MADLESRIKGMMQRVQELKGSAVEASGRPPAAPQRRVIGAIGAPAGSRPPPGREDRGGKGGDRDDWGGGRSGGDRGGKGGGGGHRGGGGGGAPQRSYDRGHHSSSNGAPDRRQQWPPKESGRTREEAPPPPAPRPPAIGAIGAPKPRGGGGGGSSSLPPPPPKGRGRRQDPPRRRSRSPRRVPPHRQRDHRGGGSQREDHRGGGSQREEGYVGRGPAEHLDERLLRRLLKLMQRNSGLNPPKEIYNRWNDFCDQHAPASGKGGKATRDPKFLSGELILNFLGELPRSFWVNLVKKVQGEGKECHLGQAWEAYCDQHAPSINGQSGKRIRDPRNLAVEFLVAFISATLERDDQRGHTLASIIDSYQFDFDHGRKMFQDREQGERPRYGGKKSGGQRDREQHEEPEGDDLGAMEFEEEAGEEDVLQEVLQEEEGLLDAPEDQFEEGGLLPEDEDVAEQELQGEENEPQ